MVNVIRKLSSDDIPFLVSAFVRAYADQNWNEVWTSDSATMRLNELVSSSQTTGFVYLRNGVIIGCTICEILSWCDGKHLEIKELFVDPDYQNQGVGHALLQKVDDYRISEGIAELYLWTNNLPSLIRFYKKMGFNIDSSEIRFSKK